MSSKRNTEVNQTCMPETKDSKTRLFDLPNVKDNTLSVLKGAGSVARGSVALPSVFWPLIQLLLADRDVSALELNAELDKLFAELYEHPLSEQSRSLTAYLRRYRILPNEESTENLIRYLVKQAVLRSPVDIPEVVVDEFWSFFQELIESPELKGLVELNLEIVRSVLRTYEPLLLEIINNIKKIRRINQKTLSDIVIKLQVLKGDISILKRQIKAIRYIKPFLQTDPKDFKAQAEIVARMVREFGPLFIKMAQVAAANADFLPEEIAKELAVFQEDVAPMSPEDVYQAFMEDFGEKPEERYFGFDVQSPIKSGSIGSVFVAKKPIERGGREVLVPVVVKVARHNLEREFAMGSLAIELMLISSQYWAPHSKLRPFLSAMSEQIKEFTKGFEQELDFKHEAEIQERFFLRSLSSDKWFVPRVYGGSGRILEMEYLEGALAVNHAISALEGKDKVGFQRQLADNFVYAVMEHLLIHNEFHGDLHPGNIMTDKDARLFLIDWGNSVDMKGKWPLIWQYLYSVVVADADALAHTLVLMSTDPSKNALRLEEIKAALEETMDKKQITPLDQRFAITLYREGSEGWLKRVNAAAHLLSNTYQLGVTINSDYLHLSRSILAMAGTYGNLYKGLSKWIMLRDLFTNIMMFPVRYGVMKVTKPSIEPAEKLAIFESHRAQQLALF